MRNTSSKVYALFCIAVKSAALVGTDILAVTLLDALAVNVLTVVPFFCIVRVALFTVGIALLDALSLKSVSYDGLAL